MRRQGQTDNSTVAGADNPTAEEQGIWGAGDGVVDVDVADVVVVERRGSRRGCGCC